MVSGDGGEALVVVGATTSVVAAPLRGRRTVRPGKTEKFYTCVGCNVECTNAKAYKAHLRGKLHTAKVAQAALVPAAPGEMTGDRPLLSSSDQVFSGGELLHCGWAKPAKREGEGGDDTAAAAPTANRSSNGTRGNKNNAPAKTKSVRFTKWLVDTYGLEVGMPHPATHTHAAWQPPLLSRYR